MLHKRSAAATALDQAQRHRLTRVRVGTSRIHGLGLFAVTPMTEGTRMLPYRGEKIPTDDG